MKKLTLLIALLLCTAPLSAQFTSPTLCYDFESTGNQSASVGSVTLTDNNTVQTTASGKSGNALLLNGTDEHLSSTTNATLEVSDQDFTWALWVYPTAVSGSRPFLVKDTSLSQYVLFYDNTAGADNLIFRTAFFDSKNVNGAISVNTWTLVIGRHQAGGTDLNGISVNGGNFSTAAATNPTGSEANDFFVGRSGTDFFEGRMDTLVFWKGYALTNGEAATLYNSASGLSCTGITGGGAPSGPPIGTLNLLGVGR